MVILPRFIRLRDAPSYLGMDIHRFNHEVRPHVSQIRIGRQGVAFDRLDLDSWADEHKQLKGCPVAPTQRSQLWHEKERQASSKETGSGTLIKASLDNAFAKALAQATLKKQKPT